MLVFVQGQVCLFLGVSGYELRSGEVGKSGGFRELSLEYQTEELGFGMRGKVERMFLRWEGDVEAGAGDGGLGRTLSTMQTRHQLGNSASGFSELQIQAPLTSGFQKWVWKKPEDHAEAGSTGVVVH